MRELFIYYRSQVSDAAPLQARIHEMQAQLRQRHPGLEARCLRRDDLDCELTTWMETYRFSDPASDRGVDMHMGAEIEAAAIEFLVLIHGPRHVEVFESCAS